MVALAFRHEVIHEGGEETAIAQAQTVDLEAKVWQTAGPGHPLLPLISLRTPTSGRSAPPVRLTFHTPSSVAMEIVFALAVRDNPRVFG